MDYRLSADLDRYLTTPPQEFDDDYAEVEPMTAEEQAEIDAYEQYKAELQDAAHTARLLEKAKALGVPGNVELAAAWIKLEERLAVLESQVEYLNGNDWTPS